MCLWWTDAVTTGRGSLEAKWGEGWGLKVWSSQNDRGPGWLIMYKQVQVDLEFEIFVYPHLLKDFLVARFR